MANLLRWWLSIPSNWKSCISSCLESRAFHYVSLGWSCRWTAFGPKFLTQWYLQHRVHSPVEFSFKKKNIEKMRFPMSRRLNKKKLNKSMLTPWGIGTSCFFTCLHKIHLHLYRRQQVHGFQIGTVGDPDSRHPNQSDSDFLPNNLKKGQVVVNKIYVKLWINEVRPYCQCCPQ